METILIVDDNKDLRFTLSEILKAQGYDVIAAGDGAKGLSQAKKQAPDLVLLDIRMPGIGGMRVLEKLKKTDKDMAVIMLTAFGGVKGAVEAMKKGAFDYIAKPFDNDELILTVKRALETRNLSRQVKSLRGMIEEKRTIAELMGTSREAQKVGYSVKIVARTEMSVLLQGESGTGKELVARMIHRESGRAENLFVAVDCGAIPETLVESELFGHEKGAFTGAEAPREGLFSQAEGGTLFLDEITNLSAAMQAKLLRVIQERTFRKIGGRHDIKANVRIIAATNAVLSESVRTGGFREDLYHRLNEFKMVLPPLRNRKEDIPVLLKRFLRESSAEHKKTVKSVSGEAMELLLSYSWPGNVRELNNTIRRAVLLCGRDEILPENLPAEMNANKDFSLGAVAEAEKTVIRSALGQTGGNKTKAAELLKMNRKTLYRRMKALNIKL